MRLHVCASRAVRMLLGTTSPSVPRGRAPGSRGGLWRAACWDMWSDWALALPQGWRQPSFRQNLPPLSHQ